MRFTIDTQKKTIHIHGSFTFDEFELMKSRMASDYKTYLIVVDTPDSVIDYFKEEEIWILPYQKLLPNPLYPLVPMKRECCGNCTACPWQMRVTCCE